MAGVSGPQSPSGLDVVRVDVGTYRVLHRDRAELVYVVRDGDMWWACWNGEVFTGTVTSATQAASSSTVHRDTRQVVTAPMPATILKVLVEPGRHVSKGETMVLLEAMKMELPLRASSEAVVAKVLCREGDIVPSDAVLVELE
jgi:biotin carboxyl carrier protein